MGVNPKDVYAGSNKKCGGNVIRVTHEYEMALSDRKRGYNCPICRGLKVVDLIHLKTQTPELLKQWDYPRNK